MFRGRLPSITVLLGVIGAVLLVPLAAITATQWQQAEQRLDAAVEVSERSERLNTLIRLTPALDREIRATTWATDGDQVLADLPPNVAEFLGANYAASLDADREAVDQLIIEVGAVEIAQQLVDARERADRGELGLLTGSASFDELVAMVEAAIETELSLVSQAAIAAGDDSIAKAARSAEATAAMQVAASGQYDLWALLRTAAFVPPTAQDVTAFNQMVGVFGDRAAAVSRVIDTDERSGELWLELQDDPQFVDLRERYEQTVEQFVEEGINEPTLDTSDAALNDLLAIAGDLNSTLESSDAVGVALWDVVDATLIELTDASNQAIGEAQGERNRTVVWLAAAAFFVVSGVLALVALVGRPVLEMADAAEQLSVGKLDTHLDEKRGPSEVRNSARALNQALESMRNTEAQAVALAEERLDDPILEKRTAGGIGESLQTAVARLASSLTERENFQQQLAHEASHDGLTKLANRNAILRYLDSAIARTQRSSSSLALLFLDIDDFKMINDSHGHHVGDAVLRHLAKQLVGAIRQGDLAGRMGGDEFVVIAEAVEGIDEALDLAGRIVSAASEPVTFAGGSFETSLSVGIAIADGDLSADELLRDADLAVYRAKSLGKGRTEVCDEDLRGEVRERETMEKALDDAIELGQFVLHFQPSVTADTHVITSYEALIRWNHPTRGMVAPNDFIPIAERSNLIARIDRWVLDAAARQLAEWTNEPDLGDKPVAVNISGRHLGSGTLTDDVLDALTAHRVDPKRLLLEVTETALLADLATAARELSLLREAGVRVALDDFGTGYMSLSHLRNLPVDVLKIDQTFIAEMSEDSDHPLIRLIVDTGHLIGVDVTAEGVETSVQAEMLTKMGVDSLQGYHFGRPVESKAIEPLNSRNSAA